MADTSISITAGAGTNVDTRTEGTNGNHRQVVVLGDPATNAGVAPVDATNGLAVDVKQSALPTGASTAAKQPALGTAGTPSSDVLTVQGVTSMTALKVDGSAVTQPVSDASGSLTVDNAGTFAVQAAQSGTWTVQPGNTANTTPWKVDASAAAVPVTDNGGTLSIDGTVTAIATGYVPHDDADSSNPVKIGGKALSADQTAVSANDRTNGLYDLLGKMVTQPYALPQQLVSGATSAITDTTATQVIAGVASNYLYITNIIVTNSHATVGTFVKLEDGSGGTILYNGYAAAAGGGFTVSLPTPLKVTTSGNGLYAQCATTGANVIVSAVGYKATI